MSEEIMFEEQVHVLLVDDEESLRVPLRQFLSRHFGYEIVDVATGEDALDRLTAGQIFDVALVDNVLQQGPPGIELTRMIKERFPDIEVILFTGWDEEKKEKKQALQAGAYRYLQKPFDAEELGTLIRYAAQQVRLRQISRAILSERELNRVLALITAAAGSLTPADEVYIALLNQATGKLDLYPKPLKKLGWTHHFHSEHLTQDIIRTGRVVKVADTEQDGRVDPMLIASGIRTFLGVPIPGPDGNLGALYLYSREPERLLDGATLAVMQTLAGQAGQAIANARAFAKADQRARKLAAVHRISTAVSASLQLEEVLTTACRAAVEFFGADHSGMVLFDVDLSQGQVVAEYPPDVKAKGIIIPIEGIPEEEQLIAAKNPLAIFDLAAQQTLGAVRDILMGLGVQSILVMPVVHKDKVLGSFSLDAISRRRRFTAEEIEQCKLFASQVAVAIAKAQAFQKADQRRRDLEALQRVSTAMSSLQKTERIFEVICGAAVELFQVQHSGLALFDDQLRYGRVVAECPDFGMHNLKFPLQDNELEKKLIQSKRPVFVSNVPGLPGSVQEAYRKADIRSALYVPVISKDQVIGSFGLDSIGHAHEFTEEQLDLCKIFASHIAVVLENVRLFDEAQAARDKLRSAFEASTALASSQKPQDVLQDIADQALHAAEAEAVSIFLIGEQGQVRGRPVIAGKEVELDLAHIVREDGLSLQVMHSGEPVVIRDRAEWDGLRALNPKMEDLGVKAALCLPLSVSGKRIGVMWIHYDRPQRFPEYEVDALQLFANQAAVVYNNIRTIEILDHLRQAAQALASAAEVNEVLEQIVKGAREVLQADSAIIWSYDLTHNAFIPEESVASGIPPEVWEKLRQEERHGGRLVRAVLEKDWVEVEKAKDRKRYPFVGEGTRQLLEQVGVESFLGLALKADDDQLGVLFVNYNDSRTLGEEERRIAQTFATHAALAFKKARLLRRLRQAQSAAQTVAEMTTIGDLNDTLRSVVKGTQDVLAADAVVLYDYDVETGQLGHPPTMMGVNYPEQAQQLDIVERTSIVYEMLVQAELYMVADTSKDIKFKNRRFTQDEDIKSLIAIPLRMGDDPVGVMFVNYRQAHHFTDEERANTELFAHQAAVAIHDAQVYERERQRAEMLEALDEAGQVVTGSLDLAEILDRIAEQAWNLVRREEDVALFADIGLVHGDEVEFVSAYPLAELERIDQALGSRLDWRQGIDGRHGIMGRVVQTGETQRVADVRTDPDYLQSHPDSRSELAVPITVRGRVIGVMNVEHRQIDAFTRTHRHALEVLAAHAAIAIENACFAEALKGVSDTSAAVNRSSIANPEALFDLVTEKAQTLFHAPAVSLMLWDEVGDHLKIESAVGLSEKYQGEQRIPRHMVDEVLKEQKKRSIYVFRIGEKALGDLKLVREEGLQCVMVAPLRANEEIIGALNIYSKTLEDRFSGRDKDLAAILANHASIAIQNAQQYDELRRTQGLVGARTALAWMGMTSSVWQHSISKHAIIIRDQAQLMQYDLEEMKPKSSREKIAERRHMIERLAKEILEKPITLPLSSEEGVESQVVNVFVRERTRQLWRNDPYESTELETNLRLSDNATIRASAEWLRRAFDELVDNAVEAVTNSSLRQITIGTRERAGYAEVLVSDTGPGLPPEIKGMVGRERIQDPEKVKGMGMGLLLANTIVEAYGGEIYVDNTGSGGTDMVIKLPLEKRSPK